MVLSHKSTNDKLFASEYNELIDNFLLVMRIPKVTEAQREALTPDNGMIVYQVDETVGFWYYSDGWSQGVGGGFSGNLSDLTINTSKDWQGYGITNLGSLYSQCIYVNRASVDYALRLKLTTDTNYRFEIKTDGDMWWGVGGASVPDTRLYRDAVNKLKSPSGLEVKYLLVTDGSGAYVKVPVLTTAQRDALSATNGMIIYNSTLSKFQVYEAGSWVNMIGAGGGFSGNLSDLTIDVNKNWNNKSITGLAGLVPNSDAAAIIGTPELRFKQLLLSGDLDAGGIWAISTTYYNSVVDARVTGDSVGRFYITHSGELGWGSGSGAADVKLRRKAADILEIDNNVELKSLKIGTTQVISSTKVLENIASLSFSPKPTAKQGYDLGSAALDWKDIYGKSLVLDGDTNLYRRLANVLTTDDSFECHSLAIDAVEVISTTLKGKLSSLDVSDIPEIEYQRFTPIATRLQEDAFVYREGDYIICRGKVLAANPPLGHQHSSWITLTTYPFSIGASYEGKGKINACDHGEEYPFGFERRHGFCLEGIATFIYLDGVYKTWTSWNGYSNFQTLTGQNWTSEKTFRIDVHDGEIDFYVNDVKVSEHFSQLPPNGTYMGCFSEACAYRGSATTEAISYFKLSSLKKLA